MANCGYEMNGVLQSISKLHGELLDVWTGPAATLSQTHWSDTEPRFKKHIETLDGHAQALRSAADTFEGADGGSGQGVVDV